MAEVLREAGRSSADVAGPPNRSGGEEGRTVEAGAALIGADASTRPLADALARLERVPRATRGAAAGDPVELAAAASDTLRLLALVALGWMWTRMALHALALGEAAEARHWRKLGVARLSMARLLPQARGLDAAIGAGAAPLMALDAAAF